MNNKSSSHVFKNVKPLISLCRQLTKGPKVSYSQKRKIPTRKRIAAYRRIVVPAIMEYKRWVANEVRKLNG